MTMIYNVLFCGFAYLYGSIPFALVIGKLFFHKDVREYGSGNLGGTNAGRVLGKRVGLLVIVLDASKALITVLLTMVLAKYLPIYQYLFYITGLLCVIGHCYPVFAAFKGGKAVSTSLGYILAISPISCLIASVLFAITLKLTKYVSLSSIAGATGVLIATPFLPLPPIGKGTTLVIGLLLIFRHHANIKRILDGTENKITWLK